MELTATQGDNMELLQIIHLEEGQKKNQENKK